MSELMEGQSRHRVSPLSNRRRRSRALMFSRMVGCARGNPMDDEAFGGAVVRTPALRKEAV